MNHRRDQRGYERQALHLAENFVNDLAEDQRQDQLDDELNHLFYSLYLL